MINQEEAIADQYNRVHDYLRISLTEKCNLHCTYCMPLESKYLCSQSGYMTTEEIVDIAKIFVSLGVKKIRLTGGEPLIRKDAGQIIEHLSKLPIELAITTNGIVIDEYINTFKTCGLKSINVSLDSLKKEKLRLITGRDCFDKVVSNIELLLNNKFYIKVNAVILKGVNDDEICNFVEWTKDKNVHVRFIEFMPFRGNGWSIEKTVSYKEIIAIIEKWYGNDILNLDDGKSDTAKSYSIKNHIGTFAVISSVTNPFCDTCNRMRLTADGKIKNCLFSETETDLLSAFRKGEDIIPLIQETIWRKKAVRAGMETIDNFGKQKNRSMISIGG